MAKSIDIDKLAAEIARNLKVFSGEVVEKVNVSSERVGKEAVKQLKQTSPKDKGDYAKSWRMTSLKDGKYGPTKRVVHNKDHYQLTHLLEHGHALVDGGRARRFPHIKEAEEQVKEQFAAEVEEAIERG